jgi:hypothetical protein
MGNAFFYALLHAPRIEAGGHAAARFFSPLSFRTAIPDACLIEGVHPAPVPISIY